jgi:hypothetical protein
MAIHRIFFPILELEKHPPKKKKLFFAIWEKKIANLQAYQPEAIPGTYTCLIPVQIPGNQPLT